eukprot:NODE_7806_length_739_cov_86.241883_g7192_i0.p1 GENE.NODE_7806_length_739_cov_86.241883_g7192_i0~~NODE_7806_length_739_cov_86.241883_g7192_i0.p1  ORF type:complete len:205 (+),score=22.00 NODE_7806_length_739_cov_86.241883_g7192_i0:55-615(+)
MDFVFNCPQHCDLSKVTPLNRKRRLTYSEPDHNLYSAKRPRSISTASNSSNRSCTVPSPFQLRTDNRASFRNFKFGSENRENKSPYVPLCVEMQKIWSKTPPRFKRVPLPPPPPRIMSTTRPQPFSLQTDVRAQFHRFQEPYKVEEEGRKSKPAWRSSPLSIKVITKPTTINNQRIRKCPPSSSMR